ncbi:AGAP009371-PA [Anopheles gambiae str. PEST]|uniref:AGAP009371-PA n=1 Tax=Anopheles gambiae TaxID=7165 RepID=A0NC40_ANOGA|nr:AGAP009371-PA [Anopheles gambiae str. PEST]
MKLTLFLAFLTVLATIAHAATVGSSRAAGITAPVGGLEYTTDAGPPAEMLRQNQKYSTTTRKADEPRYMLRG